MDEGLKDVLHTPSQEKMPKWIFCVGMRRGGSTLQAQLAAAVTGGRPIQLVTPETLADIIRPLERQPGPFIFKGHRFLPQAAELHAAGEARILYVYRDVRDVIASICKKYGIPPFAFVHGGLSSLLKEYAAWTSVPDIYVARYENMIGDIAGESLELGRQLGCPITAERARQLEDELSVSSQKRAISKAFQSQDAILGSGHNQYDRSTLLHRNHIQSGSSGDFLRTLTPQTVAALEWQAADWLKAHDYPLTSTPFSRFTSQGMFVAKALLHNLKTRLTGTNTPGVPPFEVPGDRSSEGE